MTRQNIKTSYDIARVDVPQLKQIPRVILTKPEVVTVENEGKVFIRVFKPAVDFDGYTFPSFLDSYSNTSEIVSMYHHTCQLLVTFTKGDENDLAYLGTAVAVAPNRFMSAYHLFECEKEGYELDQIFYTFKKDTSQMDWTRNSSVGLLNIVSVQRLRKQVNRHWTERTTVVGIPDFQWNTDNDVIMLQVSKLPVSNRMHGYVIPEVVSMKKNDEIVVCGYPGKIREQDYLNDYGYPDDRIIDPIPYSELVSLFSNFTSEVLSFGQVFADYNFLENGNQLIMHTASALGGMSGGPFQLSVNQNATRRPMKRRQTSIDLQEISKVGRFHGIHIGGATEMGKNFVMPVSHPAFVYQYHLLTEEAKQSDDSDLRQWFNDNKEAIQQYLDDHSQIIEKFQTLAP